MIDKIDYLEKPYDNNKMKYDYDRHAYILTLKHANYETGLLLQELWRDNDNAKWYLEWVSRFCYEYLKKGKDSKYLIENEYYLSHSKIMRDAICRFMLDVIRYNFQDGGMFMAYTSGINLSEMKELKLNIETACGIVGEQIVKNYGLGERVIKFNLNDFKHYDDLTSLKDFLLSETLITQEQYDKIEELSDIPKSYKYKVFVNRDNKFTFEDLLTMNKNMETYTQQW